MSQVPMIQCTIVAQQADAEAVVEALQEVGIVHVSAIPVPDSDGDEFAQGVTPAPAARKTPQ